MLGNFYIASLYAAIIVNIVSAIFLFSKRIIGDKPRIILSIFAFISTIIYLFRLYSLLNGTNNDTMILKMPMLLGAASIFVFYLLYPAEITSHGWINKKHISLLFAPLALFTIIYLVALKLGVSYRNINSFIDMLPYIGEFNIWIRILMVVLMILTVPLVFFIPFTDSYISSEDKWNNICIITYIIAAIAYLSLLSFNSIMSHIIYVHVSIVCILALVYYETFHRFTGSTDVVDDSKICLYNQDFIKNHLESLANNASEAEKPSGNDSSDNILFSSLTEYMRQNQKWKDPDLALNTLAMALCTNRTKLSNTIQENGFDGFSSYLNTLRILDFIYIMHNNPEMNYQDAFFDCGFRSRSTALRNFKLITNTTPSEYFTNPAGNNSLAASKLEQIINQSPETAS